MVPKHQPNGTFLFKGSLSQGTICWEVEDRKGCRSFLLVDPQSEWGAQTLFLNWPKTEGAVDLPSGLQVGWTCNDGSGGPANWKASKLEVPFNARLRRLTSI